LDGRPLALVIQGETDVFLNGPASSGFHREPPKQQLETARQTAGLVDAAGRSYSGSGLGSLKVNAAARCRSSWRCSSVGSFNKKTNEVVFGKSI